MLKTELKPTAREVLFGVREQKPQEKREECYFKGNESVYFAKKDVTAVLTQYFDVRQEDVSFEVSPSVCGFTFFVRASCSAPRKVNPLD